MSEESKYCTRCQSYHPSDQACLMARGQSSFAAPAGSEEAELRRMLAWAYSGHHLYCDDGEMQDSREQPFIDFKRDTIAELKDKMEQRGLNRLHRELHQNADFRDAAT